MRSPKPGIKEKNNWYVDCPPWRGRRMEEGNVLVHDTSYSKGMEIIDSLVPDGEM